MAMEGREMDLNSRERFPRRRRRGDEPVNYYFCWRELQVSDGRVV